MGCVVVFSQSQSDNLYGVIIFVPFCSKKEIITFAKELKRKNPSAEPFGSSPQRFTQTENAVIEEIMAVILQHRLSADHAKLLLGLTIPLLKWGKQAANKASKANA